MALLGGIDLGGTKILAAIVDGGRVVAFARSATPLDGGPDAVAVAMAATLQDAAGLAEVDPRTLGGVGIGSPGVIDAAAGTVARVVNIPGWVEPYPLAAAVGDRFGLRAAVGNDVDVATDAELHHGALRGVGSGLGVFWGSGVGGGIVVGGQLWRGRGAAGEIGHVPYMPGGRPCACGNLGCMEAYAGRRSMEARATEARAEGRKTALFEIARQRGRDHLTSGVWSRALDADDKVARRLVRDAVSALGAAIASAVNLLDLEAVVLGGGMGTRLGARVLDHLVDETRAHVYAREHVPPIHLSELGEVAGAVGASLLVR